MYLARLGLVLPKIGMANFVLKFKLESFKMVFSQRFWAREWMELHSFASLQFSSNVLVFHCQCSIFVPDRYVTTQ